MQEITLSHYTLQDFYSYSVNMRYHLISRHTDLVFIFGVFDLQFNTNRGNTYT
jgi:hypothetical protein